MKTLLALLLVGTASLAQTQSEMNAEAAKDAAVADKELNRVYKQVLAQLDDEGLAKLKVAQRAWIAYRDAEAEVAADGARGGSMAPLLHATAITDLTEHRIARLKLLLPEAEEKPTPPPVVAPPRAREIKEVPASADIKGAKTKGLCSQAFFDAYKAKDRQAAAQLASPAALDKLVWDAKAGDNPTLRLMDTTHIYYEGGSIELIFAQREGGAWYVRDVTLYAD